MTAISDVAAAWGKADKDRVHPLICHMYDTAVAAYPLLDKIIGPGTAAELRACLAPLDDPAAWAALLCGLHDLGKCMPSFQAIRVDLAEARFGPITDPDLGRMRYQRGLPRRLDTPHGLVTAIHLKDRLVAWGASAETAERIAVALGGHHGSFPNGTTLRQARREIHNVGDSAWVARRDEMIWQLARMLGLSNPESQLWAEVHFTDAAAVALAALASISDWVASDTANFPYTDTTDLDAYAVVSAQRAVAAIARLDLRPWAPPRTFSALFPMLEPRPLQSVVERLVSELDGPALVMVEAPTGEGKSKAALQAAAVLAGRLDLGGIYVAMPTQATSNQMLREVQKCVQAHPGAVPVRLVHSNARDYLRENPTSPTGISADDPGDSDLAAREWFTRKRNLLASVGVGTVDQMLKAVIRSNHVFVPLVALTNKVVVIDEVHAYQTYMSTLLDRLLSWLGRFGVPVVLLSATLPEHRRRDLVAAWQAGRRRCLPGEIMLDDMPAVYPAVTVAGEGRPRVEPIEVSKVNTGSIIELVRVADTDVAGWVLAHAVGGRSVAIMHNLVQRAKHTYTALAQRIDALPEPERPELILIHGQLPDADRRRIETRLQEAFGEGGSRPRAIVVGTQILEQGLDLDFDAVVSDLAPVDWLIQRSGRLHRHRRGASRGPAVLALTGVEDRGHEPPVFPPYVQTVYEPAILLRTWAVLRNAYQLSLPGDVALLIDAVYGPRNRVACPPGWEAHWRSADERLQRSRDRSAHEARLRYVPLPNTVAHLAELTDHGHSPSQTRERRHP